MNRLCVGGSGAISSCFWGSAERASLFSAQPTHTHTYRRAHTRRHACTQHTMHVYTYTHTQTHMHTFPIEVRDTQPTPESLHITCRSWGRQGGPHGPNPLPRVQRHPSPHPQWLKPCTHALGSEFSLLGWLLQPLAGSTHPVVQPDTQQPLSRRKHEICSHFLLSPSSPPGQPEAPVSRRAGPTMSCNRSLDA